MTRTLLCLPLLCGGAFSEELPLLGLAHAGIRVTDVEKARAFYHGVAGFDEAFDTKNPQGGILVAYFKVNDRQFIEIFPGLKPDETIPMTHIAMYTENRERSGDYVELSNQTGNTNLTRTRAGTANHLSLEVPDIKVAYQQTLDRGMTQDRKPPRFGLDERWQFNLFDPDGTRVEFMQPRDPAKAGTPVPSR
jgi:catechol 2,3-dioxygenase-like lactoylglutathione lyase family enzyme